MANPVSRNKGDEASENKETRWLRGRDRCARRDTENGFLNAELNDVAEAHGDFRAFYFIEAFYGS